MVEPMHETTTRPPVGAATVNLPFLVGTGVIIGIGVACAPAWFITGSWLFFGIFVGAFALGGLLLFNRRTGADSA
jgi:hypothetical protein